MNYTEVISYLDSLQMHKIKLGLDAMQHFLKKAGSPEKKCRFVHIAGTNGKGSVCAVLSKILTQSYYRTGVYTSPHLSSPRERIRINATYISREDFARIGTTICTILNGEKITYFEFLTALSLLWFAENSVDIILLETGMGGRLDATNVVIPLISVITSISLDHQEYLGDTITKIAAEKAGIIKHSVPVITAVSERNSDAATVISQTAQKNHAPLFRLHHEFDYSEEYNHWSWHGNTSLLHRTITDLSNTQRSLARKENDSLSIAVLQLLEPYGFRVSDRDIRKGIAETCWAGRMEFFPYKIDNKTINFLLDGAHNKAGIINLVKTLHKDFSHCRRIAIIGCMEDKDIDSMMQILGSLFDYIIATQPQGIRSAKPETLIESISFKEQNHTICEPDPLTALEKAKNIAQHNDLIVVCGSLYLIGEIRPSLRGYLSK